jgi:hypothetical protein
VPGVLAAATGSDWNADGSIMTFYFPVGLFVVVAAILYLLFSRPHKRIPARRALAPAHPGPADPGAAHAAAAAAGLPTAAGGGGTESRFEPAEAALASDADVISDQRGSHDDAGQPGREPPATEGTEAGE